MPEHDSPIVGRGPLGPALAAALTRRRPPRRGPARARRRRRGRGRRAALRARRRDRRRGARPDAPRRPARRPLLRRHRPRASSRPHEALRPAPADDGARTRGAAFAGAGCADRRARTHRALAGRRRRSPTRSGCAPFAVADEDRAAYHAAASIAANFLVDARGRRRARSPPRPASTARAARPARPRRGRELGRARAPSRRSPARSPAATRRSSPASARRSPSARPSCSALFDALVDATRDLARQPAACGMRTVRTVAELRAALRDARRAEPQRSASSRRWAPSTPAT